MCTVSKKETLKLFYNGLYKKYGLQSTLSSVVTKTHLAPPCLDVAHLRPIVTLAEPRLANDDGHEIGLGLVVVTEVSA